MLLSAILEMSHLSKFLTSNDCQLFPMSERRVQPNAMAKKREVAGENRPFLDIDQK